MKKTLLSYKKERFLRLSQRLRLCAAVKMTEENGIGRSDI